MKIFINDWNYDVETFEMDKEENREYPINEWIENVGGNRAYLMSAYVYDDFVMFFYMYESELLYEHFNSFNLEYEINRSKSNRLSGSICTPREPLTIDSEHELWQDKIFVMQYGEYSYLCDLVKEACRIPEDLKGKTLVFKKDCVSFENPVDEIQCLAIYPNIHRFNRHSIKKTFKVPYGVCDIKIPYTIPDTKQESYIIIKELKFQNMVEIFDENYEQYKEAHEQALRDYEENKDRYSAGHNVADLDEIRKNFDTTVLMLTLLTPNEKCSFEFSIVGNLNPQIVNGSNASFTTRIFIISQDNSERLEDGLYKSIISLGEVGGEPKDSYEITLESATDNFEIERKTLLEMSFAKDDGDSR